MNINPKVAILVGGAAIFVPPAIVGIVVAHFTTAHIGAACAIFLFAVILYFGWRLMKSLQQRHGPPTDKDAQQ